MKKKELFCSSALYYDFTQLLTPGVNRPQALLEGLKGVLFKQYLSLIKSSCWAENKSSQELLISNFGFSLFQMILWQGLSFFEWIYIQIHFEILCFIQLVCNVHVYTDYKKWLVKALVVYCNSSPKTNLLLPSTLVYTLRDFEIHTLAIL